MDLDDAHAGLPNLGHETVQYRRRPHNPIRRPDAAFAVRNRNDLARRQYGAFPPLASSTETKSHSLVSVPWKQMVPDLPVLAVGHPQVAGHRRSNSRRSQSSTSERWVATSSIPGRQGLFAVRWRDHCWKVPMDHVAELRLLMPFPSLRARAGEK